MKVGHPVSIHFNRVDRVQEVSNDNQDKSKFYLFSTILITVSAPVSEAVAFGTMR